MKKITQVLVMAVLTLSLHTAKASDKKVYDDATERNYPPVDYRYADPIVFMERGIEFYVFPNGEFDFNTVQTTRSNNLNRTHGAPGVRGNSRGYYGTTGTKVEHDYMGRVRRVGNVFINYDATGRVKRVGSVYMNYNSFALTQVGGLRIIYDRRGRIIDIVGTVNSYSGHYTYTTNNNHYQADNYNDYHSDNGYNNNDEDYYYYRQDGTKAKMSTDDIKGIDKK
ncbi:conserved exported hypothetical protein [Flavobacterium sp. 9AF]|uniref:hypothetical protein n=1 Tax=Flavobacterium sp. 9AF TaxID=2653142 RepID=UPI0012F1D75A|nr:hypothetical protein [Flavobacterium sp. 9AF]VXB74453.1 conserved exported hypothetical protein [Flavobacterium sp. 9AF]